MNEQYRVEATAADHPPTIIPLIDRAFDAWDGDAAALLGVPLSTFELEPEIDEPAER